jgi:hypothetical protein
MALETVCPNPACARHHSVAESAAGQLVKCRACGETFTAGASGTADGKTRVRPAEQPAVQPELRPVGRFLIRGRLGAGAFGTVYRAYDPNLKREVALKVPNSGGVDNRHYCQRSHCRTSTSHSTPRTAVRGQEAPSCFL